MQYIGKLYGNVAGQFISLDVTADDYDKLKEKADLTDKLSEKLNEARVIIAQMKRSMLVHPDCTEGSEFDDFTSSAQEIEDEIELLIN